MLYLLFLALLVPSLTAQSSDVSLPQDVGFVERDQRYQLKPNDVVEIRFRYTPEFNLTATIQPDGYITSQIAGDVKVEGLTLAEAADRIAEQSSERLKDPEVVVIPKDFVKPRFAVAGEVNNPGYHELRGDVGLIEAIAVSGGFKNSAKRKQVVLVRQIDSEHARVRVFNAKKLMSADHVEERIRVRPDDVIVVPRNRISKIDPVLRVANVGIWGLSLALMQ